MAQAALVAQIIAIGVSVYAYVRASALVGRLKQNRDGDNVDPVRRISAQQNAAKIGDVVPWGVGQYADVPPLRAQPFTEPAGQDTLLHTLLCVGYGQYRIDQVFVGETPIENIEGAVWQAYGPGEQPDLFPANVFTSDAIPADPLPAIGTAEFDATVDVDATANTLTGPAGTFDNISPGDSIGVVWADGASAVFSGRMTGVALLDATNVVATDGTDLSAFQSLGNLTLIVNHSFGARRVFTGRTGGSTIGTDPQGVALSPAVGQNGSAPMLLAEAHPINGVYTVDTVAGDGSSVTLVEALPGDDTGLNITVAPAGAFVGPFAASGSGQLVNRLIIDLAADGLFFTRDDGGFDALAVEVEIQAQPIDSGGAPTGSWFVLSEPLARLEGATRQVIQESFAYAVPLGRYQVRLRRVSTKSFSTRAQHDVRWAALRGVINDTDTDYGPTTNLAVTLPASGVGSGASTRINVVWTRAVPAYDEETESWGDPEPTTAIAWHVHEWITSPNGMGLAPSEVDLTTLLNLHETWSNRGDVIGGVLRQQAPEWSVLEDLLRVGRAKPYKVGNTLSFVRDEPRAAAAGLFNWRNITPGSLRTQRTPPPPDRPNTLRVEYFDLGLRQLRHVDCTLPGVTPDGQEPELVRYPFCIDRAQAFREGCFMLADERWRWRRPSWTTALEGLIPPLGAVVLLSDERAAWGDGGQVVARYDDGGQTVYRAYEPIRWADGEAHWMRLREADGSVPGELADNAVAIQPWGDDARDFILTQPAPFAIDTGETQEGTLFQVGSASLGDARPCIVLGHESEDDYRVRLDTVIDDPRVYEAELQTVPVDTVAAPTQALLVIARVVLIPDPTAERAQLYWTSAARAAEYVVETSSDAQRWQAAGRVASTTANITVPIGRVYVRVAGVDAFGERGPWAYADEQVNSYNLPVGDITDLTVLSTGNFVTARVAWAPPGGANRYRVRVLYIDPDPPNPDIETVVLDVTTSSTSYELDAGTLADETATDRSRRVFTIEVTAQYVYTVDAVEQVSESTPARVALTNTVPSVPANPVAEYSGDAGDPGTPIYTYNLSVDPVSEPDVTGYRWWLHDTASFDPAAVYTRDTVGPELYVGFLVSQAAGVEEGGYWRCAAIDAWGDTYPDDLALTAEQALPTS